MKAIVLEKTKGYAAALQEDGTIVKYYGACEIGDTVEIEAAVIPFKRYMKAAVAAAVALVVAVTGGSYGYMYAAPANYVRLNTAAPVEFVVNRQVKVLSVNALNEDAETVVEAYKEKDLGRCALDEAVEETVVIMYEQGYIDTKTKAKKTVTATKKNGSKDKELEKTVVASVEKAQAKIDEDVQLASKDTTESASKNNANETVDVSGTETSGNVTSQKSSQSAKTDKTGASKVKNDTADASASRSSKTDSATKAADKPSANTNTDVAATDNTTANTNVPTTDTTPATGSETVVTDGTNSGNVASDTTDNEAIDVTGDEESGDIEIDFGVVVATDGAKSDGNDADGAEQSAVDMTEVVEEITEEF